MLMKEAQTDRCVLCHLAGPVVPRPRTVYTLRYARCALRRVSLSLSLSLPFSFAPPITKFCRPRSRRPLFRITDGKGEGRAGILQVHLHSSSFPNPQFYSPIYLISSSVQYTSPLVYIYTSRIYFFTLHFLFADVR